MEEKDKEVKKKKKAKMSDVNEELRNSEHDDTIDKKENIDSKELEEVKEIIIEKKVGFNTLEVIIIMFITICFGALLGSALTYALKDKETVEISSMPKELREFTSTYNDIIDNYYEDIDKEKLLDAGIEGMINFLGDKYSVYMNKDETMSFNEQVDGEYVGIGCELRLIDDQTIISKIFENSPAKKSGIKVGDIIYKVDGEIVSELSLSEISSKVKGVKGTTTKITIIRDSEEKNITVVRDKVDIPTVESKTYDKNDKKIGYIKIDVFAANTYEQFKEQLESLEKDGIESLIIDVRDNSGGYLSTVKDIASLFLGKDKVIYQLETKGMAERIYSSTKESRNYDIAVLVNESSASASEILAGAIQESYNGTIIGVNTYGKGTVQKAYQLSSGATVKYTIQKWLTPNGNWINDVGITPDVISKQSKDYYLTGLEENDVQLNDAIKFLIKK